MGVVDPAAASTPSPPFGAKRETVTRCRSSSRALALSRALRHALRQAFLRKVREALDRKSHFPERARPQA
jgi:hypothetical protein